MLGIGSVVGILCLFLYLELGWFWRDRFEVEVVGDGFFLIIGGVMGCWIGFFVVIVMKNSIRFDG